MNRSMMKRQEPKITDHKNDNRMEEYKCRD